MIQLIAQTYLDHICYFTKMRFAELYENASQILATLVKQDQQERNVYKQFVKTKADGDWEIVSD